jgi:hypothetical protein
MWCHRGPGGHVGITLNQAVKSRPLSLHSCRQFFEDSTDLEDDGGSKVQVTTQKEEMIVCKVSDEVGRAIKLKKLSSCIDSLSPVML